MAKAHGDERRNASRKKNAPLTPAQEEAPDTNQLPAEAPAKRERRTHPRTRSICETCTSPSW